MSPSAPSSDNGASFDVRRVAVVGAGPSGLAAAKHLLPFAERVDVFEQQAEVGGVWNYSAETRTPPGPPLHPGEGNGKNADPPHLPFTYADYVALGCPAEEPLFSSDDGGGDGEGDDARKGTPLFPSPMYEDLHTNIPHTLMRFSDLAFTDADAGADDDHHGLTIFPHRDAVQRYLVRYAREVRHLVRFSTQVVDISPALPPSSSPQRERWSVTTRDLATDATETATYDAVVVASGHYATPYVPAVEGLSDFAAAHPGAVAHAKTYRAAAQQGYAGKKVVLVGNSASGLDIASQVRAVCRGPLLVSARTPAPAEALRHLNESAGAAVEEVPEIRRFVPEGRAVHFADGRVETGVDAILFCTGYLYAFPFLRNLSSPAATATAHDDSHRNASDGGVVGRITDGRRVHDLAYHLLHAHHPTLAFPGLPYKVIPFPMAEAQMAVVARVWANLLSPVPPPPSLSPGTPPSSSLEQQARAEVAEWRARNPDVESGFHVFPRGGDGRYINAMYEWTAQAGEGAKGRGREPPRWNDEALWQRSIYAEAKMAFEKDGKKARSLEEIGFRFVPPPLASHGAGASTGAANASIPPGPSVNLDIAG